MVSQNILCMKALKTAIEKNDAEKTWHLTEEKKVDVNHKYNEYGITPLHLAVKTGNMDIVKYLVKKGANVNAQLRDKVTPLHWACCKGHHEIVAYLISKGAEIDLKDIDGLTALHTASQEGHLDVVSCLARNNIPINVQDKNRKRNKKKAHRFIYRRKGKYRSKKP